MGIGIHHVTRYARRDILDEAETEGTTTVLVPLEFRDCRFRCVGAVESNNARAAGSAARLVLDLGLLNLADGREELNKVFVTSGPWELCHG